MQNKIYDLNSLYVGLSIDKRETNNCRYRLLEEKLAWDESKKYATKNINSKHFFFEEKIKIIEKMLYKLINEARK